METERPSKRVKLLSDDEDSDSGSASSGGVQLGFNAEYAKRFEHNKKRAEQHRLEEKYGQADATSDESSEEEDEDEDAELAQGALEDEFNATLKALKSKDPRIYDAKHNFYSTNPDSSTDKDSSTQTNDKPLYLRDYHRQNLLNGDYGDEDGTIPKQTYAEEQEDIRKSLIKAADAENESEEEADGFLTHKQVLEPDNEVKVPISDEIRNNARDDPDRFLSRFMENKGWLGSANSKLQAFESDEEDFDDIQDDFEHRYNMRFEVQDTKSKIQTFSRDVVTQHSVRKEPVNARQRAREAERQQKEEEKQRRHEEKAQLRKLKLDEAEEKLNMIKKAAGLRDKNVDLEQWSSLLTGDWNDDEWQKKFEENFGENYYAEQDDSNAGSDDEQTDGKKKSKKKLRKPKFDDDIDITDLIPDFVEEEAFPMTEDEGEDGEKTSTKKKKKSKDIKKEKEEAKREARKERRKLEALVDEKLDMDMALEVAGVGGSKKKSADPAPFRYRETSPTSFGLTPTEILMASDTQLNQFVGIKKLAAFRDEAKKRKDRKHLGKKARLRKWRQETFGNEKGPTKTLQDVLREGET